MGTAPRGFSLIELLIVVAIILIIAGIAIPNLLRSRIAANQASAVGSLKLFNTAEITYSVTFNAGYASALNYLGPVSGTPTSTAAGLVDSVLISGTKSGYTFSYTPSTDGNGRTDTYFLNADPLTPGTTGTVHYYSDQSGVIRQNVTSAAGASDSPIGG